MTVELTGRLATDLDGGFTEMVRLYAGMILTYLTRLTGRSAEAEDLTQDTFERAYTALKGYPPERRQSLRLPAWLMSIATNVWRNDLRRRSRRPVCGGRVEDTSDRWPDTRPGPAEQALAVADRGVLVTALTALPECYRVPVVLRHVIGLSLAEVAEVQGCPVGTAKAQVSRGLAHLRLELEHHEATLKEVAP